MSPEENTLIMIRGVIASLPAGERAQVEAAVAEFRQQVEKHGDAALIAIALLGAEQAAK